MYFKKVLLMVVMCVAAIGATATYAQEYASREEMQQLKKELQQLKDLVGELKAVIAHQQNTITTLQNQDPHDEHAPAGNKAEQEHHEHATAEKHAEAEGSSVHGLIGSIKPAVSLTGDFVANLSEDHHLSTEEDRFDLRGVDITFTGEIDDVARAVFNLSYHDDDVSLEEGYLDVYDVLPFGIDIRLGRFRTDFGLLNTVHPHALPQVDYPAIYRGYLGHEGYIDEGVGIAGTFPSPWKTPFSYSLQVLSGNRHEHGHDEPENDHEAEYGRLRDYDDLVYVGRLKNRFQPAKNIGVSWGLSGLAGKFEADAHAPRFYYEAGDVTLIWKPFEGGRRRFRWQSEFISAQIEEGSSWERTYGMYSFMDYRFASRWHVGARYDYAEQPQHSRDHLTEYSGYLTYDYTRNNRLRFQFKHARRNHDKDTNEVFLQWIFTLGSHEHPEEEGH